MSYGECREFKENSESARLESEIEKLHRRKEMSDAKAVSSYVERSYRMHE